MGPRFSIDRRTGAVTLQKPLTAKEVEKIQTAVVVKHTQLHPEIFEEVKK